MRVNRFAYKTTRWHQCLIYLICILFAASVYAAPDIKEHHLKARYLNGFAQFVHWPKQVFADTDIPMRLCILGNNPFENTLDIMVNKYNARLNQNQPHQEVHYLQRGADLSACHLLYVSKSEESTLHQIFSQIEHTLTISSIPNFVLKGGMVQFYMRDKKVRFMINPQMMRTHGLIADANLLRVADVLNK